MGRYSNKTQMTKGLSPGLLSLFVPSAVGASKISLSGSKNAPGYRHWTLVLAGLTGQFSYFGVSQGGVAAIKVVPWPSRPCPGTGGTPVARDPRAPRRISGLVVQGGGAATKVVPWPSWPCSSTGGMPVARDLRAPRRISGLVVQRGGAATKAVPWPSWACPGTGKMPVARNLRTPRRISGLVVQSHVSDGAEPDRISCHDPHVRQVERLRKAMETKGVGENLCFEHAPDFWRVNGGRQIVPVPHGTFVGGQL